jgi:hypothetical protein
VPRSLTGCAAKQDIIGVVELRNVDIRNEIFASVCFSL